jgi:putative membrane protein
MNALKYGLGVRELGGREFLVATVVAMALVGCGTKQNQVQAASAETVVAAKPVQQNVERTLSKPAATHSRPRHVVATSDETAVDNDHVAKGNTEAVLSQIHQANLTEIALGKTAEDKASAPEVRAYADQLIQDHTNLDATIAAMAQKIGTHLRDQTASTREGRHRMQSSGQPGQKLQSASGSEFDKLFLEQAGSDHQRLIQKLQQDREDASDDELEALIDKIEPILEQDREIEKILMKKEQA